jgi:hypothetical protein
MAPMTAIMEPEAVVLAPLVNWAAAEPVAEPVAEGFRVEVQVELLPLAGR